jgi:hypothetical protein
VSRDPAGFEAALTGFDVELEKSGIAATEDRLGDAIRAYGVAMMHLGQAYEHVREDRSLHGRWEQASDRANDHGLLLGSMADSLAEMRLLDHRVIGAPGRRPR